MIQLKFSDKTLVRIVYSTEQIFEKYQESLLADT
jgi:hypothetical protein